MGLELLEERFQAYCKRYPQNIAKLRFLAKKIACLQIKARKILDTITPALCGACQAPCCKGMPVDGWFTAGDYFSFRMLYDMPMALKVPHSDQRSCSFLATDGCSLPQDMRPLACVKVNCTRMDQALVKNNKFEGFMSLHDELDNLQDKLWEIIKGDFL